MIKLKQLLFEGYEGDLLVRHNPLTADSDFQKEFKRHWKKPYKGKPLVSNGKYNKEQYFKLKRFADDLQEKALKSGKSKALVVKAAKASAAFYQAIKSIEDEKLRSQRSLAAVGEDIKGYEEVMAGKYDSKKVGDN